MHSKHGNGFPVHGDQGPKLPLAQHVRVRFGCFAHQCTIGHRRTNRAALERDPETRDLVMALNVGVKKASQGEVALSSTQRIDVQKVLVQAQATLYEVTIHVNLPSNEKMPNQVSEVILTASICLNGIWPVGAGGAPGMARWLFGRFSHLGLAPFEFPSPVDELVPDGFV